MGARMSAEAIELMDLLEEARDADPGRRIEYRDRIAHFGRLAVQEVRPWLSEAQLGAFAVRVIERASTVDSAAETLAVEALVAIRGRGFGEAVQDDAASTLRRMGMSQRATASRAAAPSDRSPKEVRTLSQGQLYRRRDLREAGLLGNLYSGISYPADGVHACLFSAGTNSESYGYRDMPAGDNQYRYFGEWRGSRDMSLTGGNKAIVDRSPNLYLFVGQGSGFHRFEGRFMVVSHDRVIAEREGTAGEAIVFLLERIATFVDL